jgi:hypothetical protein
MGALLGSIRQNGRIVADELTEECQEVVPAWEHN